MQRAVRVAFGQRLRVRMQHLHIAQAEIRDQRIAVAERFLKVLAGIEEQHRQVAVDLGDQIEQHGGIRAERRHGGDFAGEFPADGDLDDLLGRAPAIKRVQPRGVLDALSLKLKRL